MNKNLTNSIFLFLFLSFFLACARVHYVGKTYSPSQHVDIFYSEKEITRDYTVIGHAIGSGETFFVSHEKIQEKLIQSAQARGADAIIISGLGRSHIPVEDGSIDEKQINASYIKYK